ncbi:MAG: hypothetical protein LLF28_06030 [Nitrospiraceae bacterium]|nr:hypothetical protein [Nitrospiraceae bacterium]
MFVSVSLSESAEVIILGDTQLRPVNIIVSEIKDILDSPVKIYSPNDAKGVLKNIAERENAKVVIALGRDALEEALQLPSSIAVVYALVITPPSTNRPNITGVYMATPVNKYVDIVEKHFTSIEKIAVIGSSELIKTLNNANNNLVIPSVVKTSFEFVAVAKKLDSSHAILILPNTAMLTETALQEVYLISFRKKIPLLGISEKYVKQGSLLALVFRPESVGRQLGELALKAINGMDIRNISASPPNNFDLYINTDTAKKMGIQISPELLNKAKGVYP